MMVGSSKRPRRSSGVGNAQSQPSTIDKAVKKDLREDVCQQVARFFYTSGIPYNCIKNPEFVKMCEIIGRYGVGFDPPSYHDIGEKYLKQEVKTVENMIEEHKKKWKSGGCTIMLDEWTDKSQSICNFLVNSAEEGTVFLYSLDSSEISKSVDKVFDMLDEAIEKVGEENVVQVITENTAIYEAAGMKLMEKRKHLYWTPCAAHCINLMLEDFERQIKLHQVTITNGRRITSYIYSRMTLISLLKNFTKGIDLIRPAMTSFATTYLTLACLNENKVALMTMFNSKEWKESRFASTEDGKQVARIVLDNVFWKNIMICLKAATPLIEVLRLVYSNEKQMMGFIYHEMNQAKEKIKENFNNIEKFYGQIWKIIDERWPTKIHRRLHAAAYFLNPALHYISNFDGEFEVKAGLYDCLSKMVTNREIIPQIDKELEDFHNAKGFFGRESAQDNKDVMAPTDWWYAYGDGCPELTKIALRILSLTCSLSGCECNSSTFEMIHTKKRNHLHQQKMNNSAFVMCNLKLKNEQGKRDLILDFDDIHSDDEWITEGRERAEEANGKDEDEEANTANTLEDADEDEDIDLGVI